MPARYVAPKSIPVVIAPAIGPSHIEITDVEIRSNFSNCLDSITCPVRNLTFSIAGL